MRVATIALGLLSMIAGCAESSTILVRVESDLAVPDELDEVVVEVEGRRAAATVGPGDLPATLELQAGDGLGPYELAVTGRRGGVEVARATRTILFLSGQTVSVVVSLEAACVGVTCDDGERCEAGACVPDGMDAGVDGGPPDGGELDDGGRDAGVDGGRDGGPVECDADETCNLADDDCDGQIDEAGCGPCAHGEYGGHVYQYCEIALTAAAARAQCMRSGYDSVVIDDAEENRFIASRLDAEIYLGMLREAGGTFRRVDGALVPPGYANWQGAEPGPSGPACALMRGNGRWRAESCDMEKPFVCEGVP